MVDKGKKNESCLSDQARNWLLWTLQSWDCLFSNPDLPYLSIKNISTASWCFIGQQKRENSLQASKKVHVTSMVRRSRRGQSSCLFLSTWTVLTEKKDFANSTFVQPGMGWASVRDQCGKSLPYPAWLTLCLSCLKCNNATERLVLVTGHCQEPSLCAFVHLPKGSWLFSDHYHFHNDGCFLSLLISHYTGCSQTFCIQTKRLLHI